MLKFAAFILAILGLLPVSGEFRPEFTIIEDPGQTAYIQLKYVNLYENYDPKKVRFFLMGSFPPNGKINFQVDLPPSPSNAILPVCLADHVKYLEREVKDWAIQGAGGDLNHYPRQKGKIKYPWFSFYGQSGIAEFFSGSDELPPERVLEKYGDYLLLLSTVMKRTGYAVALVNSGKVNIDISAADARFKDMPLQFYAHGYSPLALAALNNDRVLFDALLKKGAKITYEPVKSAVSRHDASAMALLLEYGFPIQDEAWRHAAYFPETLAVMAKHAIKNKLDFEPFKIVYSADFYAEKDKAKIVFIDHFSFKSITIDNDSRVATFEAGPRDSSLNSLGEPAYRCETVYSYGPKGAAISGDTAWPDKLRIAMSKNSDTDGRIKRWHEFFKNTAFDEKRTDAEKLKLFNDFLDRELKIMEGKE